MRVALCAVAAAATLSVATTSYAAEDARSMERRLAYLQNRDRVAFGRPALRMSSFLTSLAREHAQDMASANRIWHDPAMPSLVGEWEHVGDNVGRSTNVDYLHDGFMSSSEHRDNLMFWPYEQYGVGIAIADDGRVYGVVIFFTPYRTATPTRHTSSTSPAGATQTAAPPAALPDAQPQTLGMLHAVLALDAGVV